MSNSNKYKHSNNGDKPFSSDLLPTGLGPAPKQDEPANAAPLPIQVRQNIPQEVNFIYNSWIKSGYRSRALECVAKELYTLNQHDVITHLLGRCEVLVAHELHKPESLFGYIVYEWLDGVFVLHYAYTKQMFRGLGILSILLEEAGFYKERSAGFYTHVTKAAKDVEQKVNLIYNPYLLINPKYDVMVRAPAKSVQPAKVPDSNMLIAEDADLDANHLTKV